MSELTYAETVQAVDTAARSADRAAGLKPKIRRGNRAALRRNLNLVLDLADSLHAALPARIEVLPATTAAPESLSQAMLSCRIRLDILAGYQDELDQVRDEADLLALVGRAKALAAQLSMAARAGLDLADVTTDEEGES